MSVKNFFKWKLICQPGCC